MKDGDVNRLEAKMDMLIDLEWRIYPAAVLAVAGTATLLLGIRLIDARLRKTPTDMIGFVMGFRIAVVGLTLVGFAVSWNWHITWLFVLAVIFGAEEILESTTHLAILRWNTNSASQVVVGAYAGCNPGRAGWVRPLLGEAHPLESSLYEWRVKK